MDLQSCRASVYSITRTRARLFPARSKEGTMKHRRKAFAAAASVLAAAMLSSVPAASQTAPTLRPGELTTADVALAISRIPRFTPDRFAALPPTVREAFAQMNCQVPQTTLTSSPMNVVQGEFAAKGQRDWAALCSNGTLAETRIVWGGEARCEDRVGALQESDAVIVKSPGEGVYTRVITVATPADIARHVVRLGATLPEMPSHDGLEDSSEGARLLYYCRSGRWTIVQ